MGTMTDAEFKRGWESTLTDETQEYGNAVLVHERVTKDLATDIKTVLRKWFRGLILEQGLTCEKVEWLMQEHDWGRGISVGLRADCKKTGKWHISRYLHYLVRRCKELDSRIENMRVEHGIGLNGKAQLEEVVAKLLDDEYESLSEIKAECAQKFYYLQPYKEDDDD